MKFIQSLSLLLSVVLTAAAHAAGDDTIRAPHLGPYTESIGSVAGWQIQEGYVALDPDDTTRLMEKMQNPDVRNSYLVAPKTLRPWFAVVDYEETGHVKDDDKIDADAILKSLKEGTEQSNEARRQHGWPEMHVVGWKYAPHYEEDTKRLSWAIINETGGEQNINYFTKVLSRTGVATVVLVTDAQNLDASVADLKRQIGGFSFKDGQRYTEFTKGDKVAEYGLAGLIAGGAAAVAIKTGAWKWLVGMLAAGWKVIVGVVVAGFAGLKNLFSRKR
ncbi:MAG: DUF2167 domain-containing protein [Burkholderiales bacterium]|nr:DUF2167 domain-containing protein [Burkholderiales bacterium]